MCFYEQQFGCCYEKAKLMLIKLAQSQHDELITISTVSNAITVTLIERDCTGLTRSASAQAERTRLE